MTNGQRNTVDSRITLTSKSLLLERIAYIPDTINSAPGTTDAAAGDTGNMRPGSGDGRGEGTERALRLLPKEVVDEKLRSDGLGGGASRVVRSRKVLGEITCAVIRSRGLTTQAEGEGGNGRGT